MLIQKNLKLMSLGEDCKFLRIGDRIKGPVDNIFCYSEDYLESLFNMTYLKKLLTIEPTIIGEKYIFNELGIVIIHNKFNVKYIREHIKRLKNFYDFLSHIHEEDHYFMISLNRLDTNINPLKVKKILEDNNILEKTIVFGLEEHKEDFPLFITVKPQYSGDEDEFHKSEDDLLSHFSEYLILE